MTHLTQTCPYAEPKNVVVYGSMGENVKWVQYHLNQHGANLNVDGIFGTETRFALKEFQKKIGVSANGICDGTTREALKTSGDPKKETTDKSPTLSSNKCPYTEPTTNVKFGMVGESVKWLQWWLNYHGTNPQLEVDGEFGSLTSDALNAFQSAANLEVDCVCGKLTRAALKGDKVQITEKDKTTGNEAHKKMLIEKREQMLDYIESLVGSMYIYGGQNDRATKELIDWSARCFPDFTTPTRAARMKKYLDNHPGKKIPGIDCSGTFWLAENKIQLPLVDGVNVEDATAAGLYNTYCYPIKKSELQPLDLVFNQSLTHVGVVVRNGKIVEAMGSDVGCVLNDSVDDRTAKSIYGPKYGTNENYTGSAWTKFGRLRIYKDIPYGK